MRGQGSRPPTDRLHSDPHHPRHPLLCSQENPNDIPEGETPHTVSLFARQVLLPPLPLHWHGSLLPCSVLLCWIRIHFSMIHLHPPNPPPPLIPPPPPAPHHPFPPPPPSAPSQDLVDLAKPGDRITVTGVYRAVGVRMHPRNRELKVRGGHGGGRGSPWLPSGGVLPGPCHFLWWAARALPVWGAARGPEGLHTHTQTLRRSASACTNHSPTPAPIGDSPTPPPPPHSRHLQPSSAPPFFLSSLPPQSVYKTYIDVVHIQASSPLQQ